jgi:Transposase, Mutator family
MRWRCCGGRRRGRGWTGRIGRCWSASRGCCRPGCGMDSSCGRRHCCAGRPLGKNGLPCWFTQTPLSRTVAPWSDRKDPVERTAAPTNFIPGTNAIELLNAWLRQATRARGHFPDEQAALKVLYLVIRNPGPTGLTSPAPQAAWKAALHGLAMYYGERITAKLKAMTAPPTKFRTVPPRPLRSRATSFGRSCQARDGGRGRGRIGSSLVAVSPFRILAGGIPDRRLSCSAHRTTSLFRPR